MATYTNSSGTLVCTGTDITSAGILSNLASLSIGSGHTGDTSGAKDVYVFKSPIQIGTSSSNGTASVWDCSNEFVKLTANKFDVYGQVKMGSLDDSVSTSGGAFAVTGAGADTFRIRQNGMFHVYGSAVYANQRIRVDTDCEFYVIDCDLELEDGVSTAEGSSYGSRQDIKYDRSRVHHTGAVGVKLYTLGTGSNAATFSLASTKIEKCLYALQLSSGSALSPVLKDVEIDTCTHHTIPNLGSASNITFVNPDFTVLRTASASSNDITRIGFRYSLSITDSAGTAVQGARVIITDQANTQQVNALTNAQGTVTTIPTADSSTVLWNSTYAGSTRTNRASTTRNIVSYNYNRRSDTFTVNADFVDNVALISADQITTQSATTALGYTSTTTATAAYDQLRAIWARDYDGTIVDFPVTRTGGTLDFGSLNVTVSPGTGSATLSATAATIKATTFTDDITTTGTVTVATGATVTGAISDSAGDSSLTVTVPAGYDNDIDVYATKAHADAETNVLSSGTRFRYQAATRGGQTIWFRLTQADTSYIVENYALPAGVGAYSTTLVVTSQSAALGAIQTITDNLESMMAAQTAQILA